MSSEGEQPAPEGERIVARLRPHGRKLFWPAVLLIALAGATGYGYGQFAEEWQNLAVLVGGAILFTLLCLLPTLFWLGKRYTITTRRVVLRHGLFVRTRQELLHSRGYDITVRKNAFQSLAGSGDVLISTGSGRPVRLRDVPSADLVQAALTDLMEKSANPIAARRQAEETGGTFDTGPWGLR
ncbi:PH domain-containing protein [Marisediminicola senii]|uniref:PH domain-containing protein n=1 Tax=Marisediminicola senii TaxID=2711233 RepID=UPI0013ECBC24|nr:PH domain-containing protein [Marisediminicola senii]